MKTVTTAIAFTLLLNISACSQPDNFKGKAISFPSKDGLEISADLYEVNPASNTYILLFHQANFSRGSYRTIAPKLNELGYNCLAIDQRSGHKARSIINETTKRAIDADKPIKFGDAVQDIEATLLYAQNELKAKKIIVWGSSYSASCVIYLGGQYPGQIAGVLSFSPGEYFTIEDNTIDSYASKITCPVFITSAANEKKSWMPIYESITSVKKFYLPENGGFHGSKALWEEKKGNEGYWEAVISFLKSI